MDLIDRRRLRTLNKAALRRRMALRIRDLRWAGYSDMEISRRVGIPESSVRHIGKSEPK